MKKNLLVLSSVFMAVLLFIAQIVVAQKASVTGNIKDDKGKPIAGASITVKNSSSAVVSDNNGAFQVNALPSDLLVISNVGYETVEMLVGKSLSLEIVLTTVARDLDQVLVIGYGTQKKKDLTGAVSSIGAKDVGGRRTVQISEALQGSMPGVSVTRNSGAPGANSTILIRGITTIGNNNPLIILDGVPVSNIDNINPNDVENITVLKDAASASIYGSRAAAGVVLVSTKRARDGQKSFEYNFEAGLIQPTALPKYVSSPDYMRYFNEQATNDGAAAGPYPLAYINNFADSNRLYPDKFPFANTDWQKVVMTNQFAPQQRHDLAFTMGTGKLKSKASIGYTKSGAFYDHYTFERYVMRINNDMQINDRLGASFDVGYIRTNTETPVVNPIYEARIMPSIYDDYYTDGRYALGKDGRNPIAQLNEGGTSKGNLNQVTGRVALNYKPVNGLMLTALVSPTFDFNKSKFFSKKISYTNLDGSASTFNNVARTSLTENRTENLSITGQFLANYSKIFHESHSLDVLAGYEELFNSYESLSASRSGFALNGYPYLDAGSLELRDNAGNATESALRSFFGRVKYDFKNKYYVQGNVRYDMSSRFAPEYRGALFPSVSAGWILTEERFLSRASWLSFLKIRASYGEVGNERIGDYPYQANVNFSNALFYQNGILTPQTGAAQIVYAVEDITWETTTTKDIGADASFLDNRLSVTADYYQKRTRDILLSLDIPLSIGYEKPSQNAGILEVKGWELALGWKDKVGKLNYSLGFNLSDAVSNIVDLKGTIINAAGPLSSFKGSEYNEWFGYRSNGIYQTAAELAGSPVLNSSVSVGDIRYMDINKDGKISPDDKVLLGGSLPRYLYGGNIRMDYNNFDFSLVFQGVAKKRSQLPSDIVQPFAEAFGNVPEEMVGKFWSKNNTADQNLRASYPRLSTKSISNNYTTSDFWLIDGAYFRIKNITLGYTLKQNILRKTGIQAFRIYVAGNDLFSIHHFPKYWDPEVGSSSYPIVRTFLLGASIRF